MITINSEKKVQILIKLLIKLLIQLPLMTFPNMKKKVLWNLKLSTCIISEENGSGLCEDSFHIWMKPKKIKSISMFNMCCALVLWDVIVAIMF